MLRGNQIDGFCIEINSEGPYDDERTTLALSL